MSFNFFLNSWLIFTVRLSGAGLSFLQNIILGSVLGATIFGEFILCYTILTIFAVIGKFGLDIYILREISIEWLSKTKQQISETYTQIIFSSLVLGIGVLIIAITLSSLISKYWFEKNNLLIPLRIFVSMVPGIILINVISEALKGTRNHILSQLIQVVILPASITFAGILIWLLNSSIFYYYYIPLAILISTFLSVLISDNILKPQWKSIDYEFIKNSIKLHLPKSITYYGFSIATLVISSIVTIFLGAYETSKVVGLFAISNRLSLLVTIILSATNTIGVPLIVDAYKKKNMRELSNVFYSIIFFTIIIGGPISGLMFYFAEEILTLINHEYKPALTSFRILIVGQIINLLTGPVQYILLMTNNQRSMVNISIFCSFFVLISCMIMVPLLGIEGAAISSASTIVIMNIIALVKVRSIFNLVK